MISLLIETSTERGCIAILKDDVLLLAIELPIGYQNSKFLLPEIERAFQQTKLSPKDLSFITAGIGPGSYTGIRIGVITAKTMAYALKIPVIGICTLEGFVPDLEGAYGAVIDAKIGGIYLKMGEADQPAVYTLEEGVQKLKEVNLIVTPNASTIKPKLEALYPQKTWKWIEKGPNPVHMTQLALEKYARGEFSKDGHLELLYLRKTQAEIERGRRDEAT